MGVTVARPANDILSRMPTGIVESVQRAGIGRSFRVGQVVSRPADPVPSVWFPRGGVLALVRETRGGSTIGITVAGRESCLGLTSPDATSPFTVLGVSDGVADQVPLVSVLAAGPEATAVLYECAAAQLTTVALAAACHRLHGSEQRAARWLLDVADRAAVDELELTHEALAGLLGELRPQVTSVLARLEAIGAVHRGRGRILIRDASILRSAACECYWLAGVSDAAIAARLRPKGDGIRQ